MRITTQWLHALCGQHLHALVASLGRLYRVPLPSFMTAAVIGIVLALPAVFLLLLQNAERLVGSWEGGARISLFIHADVSENGYRQLAKTLIADPEVVATQVIAPDEALNEFRELSGFREALSLLDSNPLPPVIVVQPVAGMTPIDLEALVGKLRARPEVELAQLDREWVQRLQAIMILIQRGIWIVAVLLAGTVVLVVGNTIRLDIENRRDEIIITKLIGGTDAFIRRPFLYEGVWYGFIGGAMAALMAELGRLVLMGPARELSLLYGSGFTLSGLGGMGFLMLLGTGALLGLAGSWLAVGRHLASIEPR
jgi:cell division transport system permease protein